MIYYKNIKRENGVPEHMSNEELIQRLNQIGVNTEQAIARFMGNEMLYLSFIKRFPEVVNIEKLYSTLENGDEEAFYGLIHTLKGTAGNLGLNQVFECTNAILVELRTSHLKQTKKIKGLLQEIQSEGKQFADMLREYEQDIARRENE